MSTQLSRLKKVPLRTVWRHEAFDFTSWLTQENNLELLSEAIHLDIKHIKSEADVGKYSLDILAEDENSNKTVVIENQLESTDHDHLGKLITYAAGYDAEFVVWVVKDVQEEHKKAIEWLNDRTDEKTNFFLIKIELWQIDDSAVAPKFEIIVSPNGWAKTMKANKSSNSLTNTKLMQLEFWKNFQGYVKETDQSMRVGRAPRPQHWYDISMGTSECHIALTMNTRENSLGCEIYIPRNKMLFNNLKEMSSVIESEIGHKLEWIDAETASRIKLSKTCEHEINPDKSKDNFSCLYNSTLKFQNIFGNHIKKLNRQS